MQPGAERRVAAEAAELLPDAHEDVLRQLVGVASAGHPADEAVHPGQVRRDRGARTRDTSPAAARATSSVMPPAISTVSDGSVNAPPPSRIDAPAPRRRPRKARRPVSTASLTVALGARASSSPAPAWTERGARKVGRLAAQDVVGVDRASPPTSACAAVSRKTAKCRWGVSLGALPETPDVADDLALLDAISLLQAVGVALQVGVVVAEAARPGRTGRW